MKRKVRQLEVECKTQITKEVALGILKTGAVLGVAIMAPGLLKVIYDYQRKKEWSTYYASSVDKVVTRLYRRGFVDVIYIEGQPVVKIANKGKTEILRYDLENLTIEKLSHWDGKWRLVIFDIAEKYRKIRNIVRDKLKGMGFYSFQESVFIYPYPCDKQIKYIREVLAVPHSIKLIRADMVENDEELRKIFRLK